ncbi:helicase C-terminal domain-containing protein [Burkholderia gladioli]|uniref:helicase C-terminal domain-containing protein n=2 Tax=Burkholderia gladioli TaxID=28095 RepID=UPI001ABA3567|nr:helicase C-terminal domain-containing protein [Burkholderia gladioli]MDN7813898.1 helicase C-terminal domain-containing protein [Burkholderia gladioli]
MGLTYKDKMALSERVLALMRLRLAGKRVDILPSQGHVTETDPVDTSLIGGLAPRPDPAYHREQPPSAMGVVLMVGPDVQGRVAVSLQGRFDVTHRYIPDLQTMRKQVQVGAAGDKIQQKLPDCFIRFTVEFADVSFTLDSADLNVWSEHKLQPVLQKLHAEWKKDPRIFRISRVNDRGFVDFTVPWGREDCASDTEFAQIVAKALFIGDGILEHDVVLRTRMRPPPPNFQGQSDRFLLEVYLQNNTDTITGRSYGLIRPSLLDVGFEITLIAGQQFDVPHRLAPEDYRYQPEDGVAGYGVTCAVEKLSPNRFRTNAMPVFAQPRIDSPSTREVGMPLPVSFELLAKQPLEVLDGFVTALRSYHGVWDRKELDLDAVGKTAELQAVRNDRKLFVEEVKRIEDGVELLRQHEDLRRCFIYANEVMLRAVQLQGKSFDGWHLFQLGFILTQVRAIFERHALPHERQGVAEFADVLWFATGGGKTEAYLGIICFAMFYGRIKGRLYGTTAWMRFPLRMLSAQQFQRLSYVVAQAEMLRCRERIKGHPFTVGYYTGAGTPGNIGRSDGRGTDLWLPEVDPEQLEHYRFVTDCPYCGSRDSVHMVRDLERVRMKHCCSNLKCWSRINSSEGEHGEGIAGELGIYVSDEECYRYLPTVLVGTVDKLAVIAHNERFAGYLGAFRYFCPEHGFTSESKCRHQRIRKTLSKGGGAYESVNCGNNSRTSKVKTLQLPPMLDPGFSFLIQDELHLLRESLGNFDAHYETLLQALQVGHNGQPSKVLAATATIKDFENHILHLYMRKGRRFPAPGASRSESFYARISRERDASLVRRWFVGVFPLSFTRGAMERASAEVASRYQDLIDEWIVGLSKHDPAVLAQCGISAGQAEDVSDYVGKFLSTDLIYANQKRQTTAIREHLDNVNARDGRDRTHRLLDGQTSLDDILEAIHEVETKTVEHSMRHLVATSVVSHGVDIAELNFMVLDGWPRSSAEYIQSSARSGRVHPGIVMSVLSSGKLFESGVFLNFGDYHFFLDKLVDSVPINRFAPNVLQRTLPGVFSAVVYNWAKFQLGWGETLNRTASQLHKALNDGTGVARQNLRNMLIRALDVPLSIIHHFDIRVLGAFRLQLEGEIDRGLHRLQHLNAANADKDLGAALESIYQFAPMRSFRDIENQVEILSAGEKENRTLHALGR